MKYLLRLCEGNFEGEDYSVAPASGTIVVDKFGCKAGHVKYLLEGQSVWEAADYFFEPFVK